MSNFNQAVGWGDDKQEYADFCLAAANDENLFKNFKQNHIYRRILEHVTPALGWQYYNLLTDETKALIPEAHKINDICNPDLMEVPEGPVSPTTLRYLKVVQDLKELNFELESIVEIGGGYGGQACLINAFLPCVGDTHRAEGYTVYDLAGPASLQNRYNLFKFDFCAFGFETLEIMKPQKYDLVISNYAFSELNREIQDIYLEKVILPAKHGYLTYNPGQGFEYSLSEIYEILKDKDIKIHLDHPMVESGYPENRIITW